MGGFGSHVGGEEVTDDGCVREDDRSVDEILTRVLWIGGWC